MAKTPDVRAMMADLNRVFSHESLAEMIAKESGEPICQATVGRYIDGSRKRIPFTVGWAVINLRDKHAKDLRKAAR